MKQTNPDYTLYIPSKLDYEGDNVHLHVITHPKYDGLIAFWTQSSIEGWGNNHIVMAFSPDGGKTWTKPEFILGSHCADSSRELQASWGFPVVSSSGRIYLFYFRETPFFDNSRQLTAAFACIYTDDLGRNWSKSCDIKTRNTPFDADPALPQNNNVYQMPIRLPDGRYFAGYTKWTSYLKYTLGDRSVFEEDTHCYFMRFENIDDDPDISDIKITWLPDDINGVSIPFTDSSSCQEPCPIVLPDGRLFSTFRSSRGTVFYSVSADCGQSWREPAPLLFSDGKPFLNPVAPCPVYDLGDGRYVQFYHNHSGSSVLRNPVYIAYGRFDPDALQPLVYESGREFMRLDPEDTSCGAARISMYSSVTLNNGEPIVWYPDRKFFLLGKKL
ncbi:MAG: sialidase family protein [Firmicutes bacterium]|nr:sialidase family protein [Bacillota bacterium]